MRRLYRAAALVLLPTALLTACVPSATTRSPAELKTAGHARELAAEGQFDDAIHTYLGLAESSGQPDRYRLLAAEVYRQEGQLGLAAPLLQNIQRQRLDSGEAVHLDLLQAELALSQHNTPRALALTDQPNLSVPAQWLPRLQELRARALEASGDYWLAARNRAMLDSSLEGLDQSQNRQALINLLMRLGPEALKARAKALQPADTMQPWTLQALGQMGIDTHGDALGQPVGTLLAGDQASVREGYLMPSQIALLLPASGPAAGAANAIREGFFAGYEEAARNHAPRPLVKTYDSGNTPASSVAAYQQAVHDGARLVVGPLARDAVSAVLGQRQLPVPVLSLNYLPDQTPPPANTSTFGLLPEAEGSQAADHMLEAGLHQAWVIVSDADFAQRAASAFKAEFTARGGQIEGMSTLTGGSVNYTAQIHGMGMPLQPTSAPGSAGTAPAPAATAGLFISMRAESARLLLPQLHLARIALPVYATSHVFGGSDNAGADGDLNGVEFSDAPWLFDAQAGLPSHAGLAALLPTARGSAARLFAFGMDAWSLVPYLDWMRSHPGSYLPGASGQLTADRLGRISRRLIWARFDNGLAHPIGGTLDIHTLPPATPATAAPPAQSLDTAGP